MMRDKWEFVATTTELLAGARFKREQLQKKFDERFDKKKDILIQEDLWDLEFRIREYDNWIEALKREPSHTYHLLDFEDYCYFLST